MKARSLLIVLDGLGVGHAPDAAGYGDEGANTLGRILSGCPEIRIPALRRLGLDAALDLAAGLEARKAAAEVAVLTEMSAGKDTTTGHWELAGVVVEKPFPVFSSFPAEMVAAIESAASVRLIGNRAASGTVILEELGEEHLSTGCPILYTSADSVLQIAAHEDVMPLGRLHEVCRIARAHAGGIGRVIARPFAGRPGGWVRTAGRHDFSLTPPRTILNDLSEAGIPVTGVGKIGDIFNGSGLTSSFPTASNAEGMERISSLWRSGADGFLFANLVDFDSLFGHRRDVAGYARALEEFDAWLGRFLQSLAPEDSVMITADHGNDPGWKGTDHTRENVPWLCYPAEGPGGRRNGFFHVAGRIARQFGLPVEWSASGRRGNA